MGGFQTQTTSMLLREGSTAWAEGPTIPGSGTVLGCAVEVTDGFLLIGGLDHEARVIKFTVNSGDWLEAWPSLRVGRFAHGCVRLQDTVIVTGGYYDLASTEILQISTRTRRNGGDLKLPRNSMAMGAVGPAGLGVVYAAGGMAGVGGTDDIQTDTVESWDPLSESWSLEETRLGEAKFYFGFVVIPTSLICPV